MEITAHRGLSGHFPENTLSAFRHGCDVADAIELDIHVTKDKQLVVIHDEAIDRTSNGHGLVREMTVAQLKTFDYSKGQGETIATLEEVLQLLTEKNFSGTLNIEAKTNKYPYPNMLPILKGVLEKEILPFSILISSFNLKTLIACHKEIPQLPLALLCGKNNKKAAEVLKYSFIESIHPDIQWVKNNASELFSFPKKIRPWTVNKKEDVQLCRQLDLTGIITDFPSEARKVTCD